MDRAEIPGERLPCPMTHELYRIDPGVYLVVMVGFYSFDDSQAINEVIFAQDDPDGIHGRIYFAGVEYGGHEPDARDPRRTNSRCSAYAIITDRPSVRVSMLVVSKLMKLLGRELQAFREIPPAIRASPRRRAPG